MSAYSPGSRFSIQIVATSCINSYFSYPIHSLNTDMKWNRKSTIARASQSPQITMSFHRLGNWSRWRTPPLQTLPNFVANSTKFDSEQEERNKGSLIRSNVFSMTVVLYQTCKEMASRFQGSCIRDFQGQDWHFQGVLILVIIHNRLAELKISS